MKVCSKKDCEHNGKLQPLSNFYKHTSTKDGHQSMCKDCNHKYQKVSPKERNDWLKIIIG